MRLHYEHNYQLNTSLRPAEQALKQLYFKNPFRMLEHPHEFEYCRDIFLQAQEISHDLPSFILSSNLEEPYYFNDDFDCEIYQHLRYLPANWHSHTFFEVICVIHGSCTNYILEQELPMSAGDICIIAPNTSHAVSAFSDDCIILNLLLRTSTFETAFFGTLIENDILSDFFSRTLYHSPTHPYLLFQTGKDTELTAHIWHIQEEFRNNHQYKNRMLNALLETFFILLLRNHGANVIVADIPELSSGNRDLLYILKYIQTHYASITLKELSQFFNYSERQMQRLIKASTGLSFSDNIQKLRMNHAVKLLEHPEYSVAIIAEELGYSDAGTFRHVFKKYYGITPSEYRSKKEHPGTL